MSSTLEIHYEVAAGDRPILLGHGFASNSTLSWVNTGWLAAIEQASVADSRELVVSPLADS